jgi:hypothetical protein
MFCLTGVAVLGLRVAKFTGDGFDQPAKSHCQQKKNA